MKVLQVKALRGPNIWSIRKCNLIEMVLDLEELEEQPTNKIPGFYERIQALIPSLYSHECSEGHEGGFFEVMNVLKDMKEVFLKGSKMGPGWDM
jgi:cyanophycin synthetase